MNEEVHAEVTEQPEAPQAEPELSLAEHEAQFPGGKPAPVVVDDDTSAEETPEEKAAHHSAQQKRDEEGQFKQGKRRAKSQQARAEDVPRIAALTRQLRERDEELARLRTPPTVPQAPGSADGNGHAPAAVQTPQPTPTQPKQGERFVLPAPPFDPEPVETDPRFGGDFTRYLTEAAKWSARQEVRQTEFDRYVDGQNRAQKETEQKELTDFATRVDSARD